MTDAEMNRRCAECRKPLPLNREYFCSNQCRYPDVGTGAWAERKRLDKQARSRRNYLARKAERIAQTNAYQRTTKGRAIRNAAHDQWVVANPEKVRAHWKVKDALKRGILERRPCERCGSKTSQAHHEDYSKPLDVMWLCRGCHSQRHYELRVSA